eukprot:TRINITY_DN2561_c0_g1_i2.p1 TRINITY_DN2561_c0_g1~~TRINITY_DN2561_c0_g1_i2.p1  ORF type:complete len:431 (-),score=47.00 TRINITY_DN2561_c0_g1_i2:783-2075(-)
MFDNGLPIILLLGIIVVAHCQVMQPSQICLDNCLGNQYSQPVCGLTDGYLNKTYYVGQNSECYWEYCSFTAEYYGQCGCPNDCFSEFDHGNCTDSKCVCSPDYRGSDCSLVKCPNHNCSGNGVCVTDAELGDYCLCDIKFTGPYCSIPILDVPVLPYGSYYNRQYYFKDNYGDHHPVFNKTVLAVIMIDIDPTNLSYVLTPWNAFNQTYVSGNFTFNNGHIIEKHVDMGFKIKGASTRKNWKKNWKVSFSSFQKGNRFYDLKQIALKQGDIGEPQVPVIVYDMVRSIDQPVQRGSFARLYVNGISWGVYWLAEEINDEWLKSYYEKSKGNLYKGTWYANLEYLSDDPEVYKNYTKYKWDRWTCTVYEQDVGDGDFSRFAQLVKIGDPSQTPDDVFVQEIVKIFDVHKFLQYVPVEAMVSWWDGYSCGENN